MSLKRSPLVTTPNHMGKTNAGLRLGEGSNCGSSFRRSVGVSPAIRMPGHATPQQSTSTQISKCDKMKVPLPPYLSGDVINNSLGLNGSMRMPGLGTPLQTHIPRARSRTGTIIIIIFAIIILLVITLAAVITYVDLPLVLQSSWRPPHSHCPNNLNYAYDGSHTMQAYLVMDGIYSDSYSDKESDEFRQISYKTTRELDRIFGSGDLLQDAVICTEITRVSYRYSGDSNFPGSSNHNAEPWQGLLVQFLLHIKKRQHPEYVLAEFSQEVRKAGKRISGNRVYLDALDIQNTEELLGEFRLSDYTTVPYNNKERTELRKKIHSLLHSCVVGAAGFVRVVVDSITERKVHFRFIHTKQVNIASMMEKLTATQFINSAIVKPGSLYITDKYRIMGHIVFKNSAEETKFCQKNTEAAVHSLLGLGDLSSEISLVRILCNSLVRGLVHVQLELNDYHPSKLVQEAFLTALKQLYSTKHRDIIVHQTVWFHDVYSVFVGIPIETFLIKEKPHIETSEVVLLRQLRRVEKLHNDVEDVYIYRNQQDLYFQISLRQFHSLHCIQEAMHKVLNYTSYRISDYQLSNETMEVIDVYPVLGRIKFCIPISGRTGAISSILDYAQHYEPTKEEAAVVSNMRMLFYQSSVARDFIEAYPIGRDDETFSVAIFLRSYHPLSELFTVTQQYYSDKCSAPYQLDTSNIMLTDELNFLSAIISPAVADLHGRKQEESEENIIPAANKLVFIKQPNVHIPWFNLQPQVFDEEIDQNTTIAIVTEEALKATELVTEVVTKEPSKATEVVTEEPLKATEVVTEEPSKATEGITEKALKPTDVFKMSNSGLADPGSLDLQTTSKPAKDEDIRPAIDFSQLEHEEHGHHVVHSADEVIDLNMSDDTDFEVDVDESPHSISEVREDPENVHKLLERKVRDKSSNRGKSFYVPYPATDNKCNSGDLDCDDGLCLPSIGRCNGYIECATGADEKNCTCRESMKKSKICDEIADCIDGSDETGCDGCGEDQFKCIHDYPMACFTQSQRCDGTANCASGEDERNCLLLTDELTLTKIPLMTRTSGYLTAMVNGTWYTVCNSNLDKLAVADKVCNNMISNYDAPPIGGISGRSTINIVTKVKDVLLKDIQHETMFAMQLSEDQWSVGFGCPTRKAVKVECPSPICGVSDHEDQKLIDKRSTDSMQRDKRDHPDLEDGKIVGGEKADFGEYPWICGLYRDEKFVCGLSLVHKLYGITAAHCITTARNIQKGHYKKYFWSVICGKHRRSAFSLHQQYTTVEKIYVHSKFNTYFHNDLALLKFKSPIHLNKWASQICVPSPNVAVPEYCTVLGWGVLNEGLRKHSDDLRELKIPIMKKCPQHYHEDEIMVCAAYWEQGGKDACQGDSGGPLVCKLNGGSVYYQLGIVSYGRGCARKMRAGAYTRVSSYVKWMQTNMRGSMVDVIDYPVSATVCPGLTCGIHNKCVLQKYICDGKVDCGSGEDEFLCIDFPEIQEFLTAPEKDTVPVVKRSLHRYNSTTARNDLCSIPLAEWKHSRQVLIRRLTWKPDYKEITFMCREGYSTGDVLTTSCKDGAGWTNHVPNCTLIS